MSLTALLRNRAGFLAKGFAIAAFALAFSASAELKAVAIDGAQVLLSKSLIIGDTGSTSFGSYTYDSVNNVYYVAVFGSGQGLRKIYQDDNGNWTGDTYVYSSDLNRYIRSTDVAGGLTSGNDSGTTTPSGILLNPKAITVTVTAPANVTSSGSNYTYNAADNTVSITYAAGSLAYIIDPTGAVKIGGTGTNYAATKKLYAWDLRQVGAATTSELDYNNALNGAGTVTGAYGTADWNDVFRTVVTEDVVRAAVTATGTTASTLNIGRQFAWSTDGQSVYAADSNNGLLKINAVTGATTVIAPKTNSEVAVLSSSVRNLGGGLGDQVLFVGTNVGNAGGISYVVDNSTTVTGAVTLVSSAAFVNYSGSAVVNSVAAFTTDSKGNIYFFDSNKSLQKYDTEGRLSVVLNNAQIAELDHTVSGTHAASSSALRLQVQETATGTTVTWRDNLTFVAGAQVSKTGDFNKDNVVDQADRTFFITQFNKTVHGFTPNPSTGSSINDYKDYIAADLNGDGVAIHVDTTGTGVKLAAASVTSKDLDVLKKFTIELKKGDFNWDGTSLDSPDVTTFWSNFGVTAASKGYTAFSVFDGDVSGDGLVNKTDYYSLENLAADFNADGKVDATDYTILQLHWGQTVTDGYASGDSNGDGKVDATDYTALQLEWGTSSSFVYQGVSAAAAAVQEVPEPTALLLLGAAFVLVALRRRNRS